MEVSDEVNQHFKKRKKEEQYWQSVE